MLLCIYKMGVHWYFPFAVKTADNSGPSEHRSGLHTVFSARKTCGVTFLHTELSVEFFRSHFYIDRVV